MFVIVVAILLLLIATPIALMWWNLARKASPYRDELGAREGAAKKEHEGEVIVIPGSDGPKRGA